MQNLNCQKNVYPQISPSTRTTGEPADMYHLNYQVKTLRTHDLLLIMPFMIPTSAIQGT